MTAQISKSEQDERGLLPYPVIIAATKGDPEAMNIVVPVSYTHLTLPTN